MPKQKTALDKKPSKGQLLLQQQPQEVEETPEESRERNNETVRTVMILLLFSVLMFSLPFLAFYLVRYYLEAQMGITDFANTCWSVLSAVITVNLIICAYVYVSYKDNEKEIAKNKLKSS